MKQQNPEFDADRGNRELSKLNDPKNNSIRNKVFIGGLDYQMSDEVFRKHFEQYGEIKEC